MLCLFATVIFDMDVWIVVLVGLVLGSFISALTYRLPRGISNNKGRSFCDSCKKSLPWYVNIPVFSYLFLGGKSVCCRKKISVRYPLIELASMFGALYFFSVFSIFLAFIYYLLFLITLTIFVIDVEHQIIPDELSLLVLVLVFLSPVIAHGTIYSHLFSGFLYSFSILFIHLVTKGKGMGLGDVKLALGMGVWLGLYKGLIWLFASFLTGGVIASILLLTGRAKLKQKIAFGPFLIIGFWIALLI